MKETRSARSQRTDEMEIIEIDFSFCKEQLLRNGCYDIVFAHPGTLISGKYGGDLLLNDKYQENVRAIVVDEVHCIIDYMYVNFNAFYTYFTFVHFSTFEFRIILLFLCVVIW